MKEFDLFGVLVVFGIVIITFALIGTMDFSEVKSFGEIAESLQKPLELKNWHYALLMLFIFNLKK